MSERLTERIRRLIEMIVRAGGWGSVTVVVEKGRVARIIWSVDEKVNEDHPALCDANRGQMTADCSTQEPPPSTK